MVLLRLRTTRAGSNCTSQNRWPPLSGSNRPSGGIAISRAHKRQPINVIVKWYSSSARLLRGDFTRRDLAGEGSFQYPLCLADI